jgi:hypothetical protein
MAFYLKDPGSHVDYAIDWSQYLDGATIVASEWAVEPVEAGGLAVEAESFEPVRAAARIGGGHAGHVYSLVNRVTLSDGSDDARSIALRVEPR